jgi:histidyl-tRNA synthetase
MEIKRPRGTQDFLPQATAVWQRLEAHIHGLCRRYGYQEIRTPIFEGTELFSRGVGQTTDIVTKEMFTFADRGERSLTLRPEGTASVARAYTENKLYGQPGPQKLYYLGAMFRQERPQAGRYHEFHQFGAELLGTDDALADAEIIALAWELLTSLGLEGLELHLNSVGCPVCRRDYHSKLQEHLAPLAEELCADCRERLGKNPLRVLDCKKEKCRALTADAPLLTEHICPECAAHFAEVKMLLDAAALPYTIDPRLVRGLDYYQKTAFEVLAAGLGAQNAVCGGGRYDGLVEEIGGPRTPGSGFALGLERLVSLLELSGKLPATEEPLLVNVAAVGAEALPQAFALLCDLRRQGIRALIGVQGRSLKSQVKYADRVGAAFVIFLGAEELEQGVVRLRNMGTGEEKLVSPADLLSHLT